MPEICYSLNQLEPDKKGLVQLSENPLLQEIYNDAINSAVLESFNSEKKK